MQMPQHIAREPAPEYGAGKVGILLVLLAGYAGCLAAIGAIAF